jgi:hypothetical protein
LIKWGQAGCQHQYMQKTSLMPPQGVGINQNITRIKSTKQPMNTLGCTNASQSLAKNNP